MGGDALLAIPVWPQALYAFFEVTIGKLFSIIWILMLKHNQRSFMRASPLRSVYDHFIRVSVCVWVQVCVGQRKHNESCESLRRRSGMKYPKTSHLRLQSITSTELAGLAQYSLKKFLFGRWNWSALINWSSLTKKGIFSGFFKSYKWFS